MEKPSTPRGVHLSFWVVVSFIYLSRARERDSSSLTISHIAFFFLFLQGMWFFKFVFVLFLLQVVKVMVLKCEPQQERLLLSFRLSSRTVPEGRSECIPKKKQQVKYQIGEVLNSVTIPLFASKCSLKYL